MSTLDQLNPAKSDSVELEFPSGFRCRIGAGDVPSLIAFADQGSLGSLNNSSLVAGARAGLAFILPLYRRRAATCDRSMQLQNALSQLEIAEKLVSSGAMTNEEYLKLARRIKAMVFGV